MQMINILKMGKQKYLFQSHARRYQLFQSGKSFDATKELKVTAVQSY